MGTIYYKWRSTNLIVQRGSRNHCIKSTTGVLIIAHVTSNILCEDLCWYVVDIWIATQPLLLVCVCVPNILILPKTCLLCLDSLIFQAGFTNAQGIYVGRKDYLGSFPEARSGQKGDSEYPPNMFQKPYSQLRKTPCMRLPKLESLRINWI